MAIRVHDKEMVDNAVQAVKEGKSIADAAKEYDIPYATVYAKCRREKVVKTRRSKYYTRKTAEVERYTRPRSDDAARICTYSEVISTILFEKTDTDIIVSKKGSGIKVKKHKIKEFASELKEIAEMWG